MKLASDDYVKVMVDYGQAPKHERKNIDTGLFQKIYHSKTVVEKGKESLTLDLGIQGEAVKKKQYI